MKEFVKTMATGDFGLISVMAELSLNNNDLEGFVDCIGQQTCIDAPDSMRRRLGEDLFNRAVELYASLPEELKTYTTGKPDEYTAIK